MNESTKTLTDSGDATHSKAAYKFMASKKESPPVTGQEDANDMDTGINRSNIEKEEKGIAAKTGVDFASETISSAISPGQEANTGNQPKNMDTARRKRTGTGITVNYAETFLNRYELFSRQGLHLEKETIATIKRIIHSIGDERLTVSGFVENVLRHHFESYKDEINRIYDEKWRKPIA